MRVRLTPLAVRVLALCALALPLPLSAQQLDWEVEEKPAGPAVTWLRGVRDGITGLFDDALDLQLGVFSEATLTLGSVVMAASDAVGLVDDNPVTEHVFKATFSKPLAKTAWLLHSSGSEAILGSHGIETERYIESSLAGLNPLLAGEDVEWSLPLEPLAFAREGLLHTDVYKARVPGSILGVSLLSDVVIRPAGNLVRIGGFHSAADRLEEQGNALVRQVVD